MIALVATFSSSIVLMLVMMGLKIREVESGNRNALMSVAAVRLDPLVGRVIDGTKVFRGEILNDLFRFVAAKFGLWTAKALISLRNFSSKLAAHLYHTSRKVESGDPATSHPSFFIKAILEFRDKLREDNKK